MMSQSIGSYCIRTGVVLSACLACLLIRVATAAPADIPLADVLFDFQMEVVLDNAPANVSYMWVNCRILDRDGRVPANAAGGSKFDLSRGVQYGSSKGTLLHKHLVQVRLKGHLFGDEGRVRELVSSYNCYVRQFIRQDGSTFAPPAGLPAVLRNTRRVTERHIMAGLAIAKSGKQGRVVIDDFPLLSWQFPGK